MATAEARINTPLIAVLFPVVKGLFFEQFLLYGSLRGAVWGKNTVRKFLVSTG